MSILSDAVKQGPPRPKPSNRCAIGRWLETLSDADRTNALAILAPDSGWRHGDIFNLLREPELAVPDLTKYTVGNHRRGDCSCERS